MVVLGVQLDITLYTVHCAQFDVTANIIQVQTS